jgi:hypothetical protein
LRSQLSASSHPCHGKVVMGLGDTTGEGEAQLLW